MTKQQGPGPRGQDSSGGIADLQDAVAGDPRLRQVGRFRISPAIDFTG